jgi:hypothetical protein
MTSRSLAALALLVSACGGDRARSPVCGLALLTAPTLIHEQLKNARAIITEVPRGLPETLPARMAGQVGDSGVGKVRLGYAASRTGALLLGWDGPLFPRHRDAFALLVVDDSSHQVEGVMLYDVPGPDSTLFPLLGHATNNAISLPVYGVTVNYTGMSNPRCPLFAFPGAKAPS